MVLLLALIVCAQTFAPGTRSFASSVNGIVLTLSTNKLVVDSGEEFSYLISYSASSTIGNYTNPSIKLLVPTGVTYTGKTDSSITTSTVTDSIDFPGQKEVTFQFKDGILPAGSAGLLVVKGKFESYVTPDGTSATTKAEFTATENGTPVSMESNEATVTSQASAAWSIEVKRIAPIVEPFKGSDAQYEIIVKPVIGKGIGLLDISNIVVTAKLDNGAVFVYADNGGTAGPDNTVVWNLSDGLRNAKTLKLLVNYPYSMTADETTSTAEMTATPLGGTPFTIASSVTHGFETSPIDAGASIELYAVQREISPGQTVTLNLSDLSNNANVALDSSVLEIMTPTHTDSGTPLGLQLQSVKTAAFSGIATYDVYYTLIENPSAGDWTLWTTINASASTTLDATALGTVKGIQVRFGTLPIDWTQRSNFEFTYKVADDFSVSPNSSVSSTANFSYVFEGQTKTSTGTNSTRIVEDRPLLQLQNTVSQTSAAPSETVTYTLSVTNHAQLSSGKLDNPVIYNMLPVELDYVPGSWTIVKSAGTPTDPTFTAVPQPSGETKLTWSWDDSNPTEQLHIGENVQIQFKAKIKPRTQAKTVMNTFGVESPHYLNDVNYSNQKTVGTTTYSVKATSSIKVEESAALQSRMWVKGELDASWSETTGSTTPGGQALYRLEIQNIGNVAMKDLVIVNPFPRIGDTAVLNGSIPRGSQWGPVLMGAVTAPNYVTVQYSTTSGITMNPTTAAVNGVWTASLPADPTSVTAIKFIFDSSYVINPQDTTTLELAMRAPVGAPTGGEIAWNSFAYHVKNTSGQSLLPAESYKVGMSILPPSGAQTATASAATLTPVAGADNTITLTVMDSLGNTDTNFNGDYDFTISGVEAAPNGSYGSFAGTTINSASQEISVSFTNGVATPDLVLHKADEQTIGFSFAGIATPETNTITITPSAGSLSAMVFVQDITAPTASGGQFAQQPKVALVDDYGNIRTGDNSTQVTVVKKDAGAWTLTGTTTVTATAGVATFSDLGATNAAQVAGAQLAFQATGLTEITSRAVTLPWSSLTAPSITSVAAGDGHVAIGWNSVYGSVTYAVYQREAHGSYGAVIATVEASVLEYDALGLTNGTTYYFMVKAINPIGESDPSNEVSATPQVPAPGAPNLLTAESGNAAITLTWAPVSGSTGYNIYQRLSSDAYGAEAATVTGSVYSHQVTGLTNGTMYYFTIKAVNPGGVSDPSNEVSATPMTVPSAPTEVRAVGGNGQATITFTAPDDQGGSPITGYEVTVLPDHRTVTGHSSPITITGLTNGRAYTFIVKAINSVGLSTASVESNAVTPYSPSSDNNGASPQTPSAPVRSTTVVEVLVNGKPEQAGIAATTEKNGRTIMTVTLDPKKLGDRLQAEGSHSVITIPIRTPSDVMIGVLNGQMIKDMEVKQQTIEIRTGKATYTLPALQVNIDAISEWIGREVELEQIQIEIEISEPTEEQLKIVEDAVNQGSYALVVPPLNFSVRGSYGDVTVDVSKFNAYVYRTFVIPDGVDPNKITTGVVVDPDGTVRHVPTKIERIDGKYYATINSLTNSTYALISNPVAFKDVAGHWAEEAVNEMGSRLVVSGVGNDLYNPDQAITRAEFAAIMVRAMGLKENRGAKPFSDVRSSDWYSGAVRTALDYELINGYEDGTFRPQQQITREQAMVVIARAMEVTGLKNQLPAQDSNKILQSYDDAKQVSLWARDSVADVLQAGIITGRSNSQLAPQAFISRAEVAMIIQRLLQQSKLI